jgi:hypothetical protein
VAACVCVLVLFGSCGAKTTTERWAAQVCAALAPWRSEISDLNARAQHEMSRALTPEQTRTSLLTLLAGGEQASETALAAVTAAGMPPVDGGEEVARRFAASLRATAASYGHAWRDLAALPTDEDAAFYDGVVTVMARLNTEYAGNGIDIATIDSPELRAAFERVDECR